MIGSTTVAKGAGAVATAATVLPAATIIGAPEPVIVVAMLGSLLGLKFANPTKLGPLRKRPAGKTARAQALWLLRCAVFIAATCASVTFIASLAAMFLNQTTFMGVDIRAADPRLVAGLLAAGGVKAIDIAFARFRSGDVGGAGGPTWN
ncbi:hypothetical protein [Thermomonas mangrovi]|uniref:hypothetical protein n=1 Tax=Thermomonas mangrovi TaxID=2993316 RepID=UPI002307C6F6|nr:hypothetical protein [Thermomonas mangrovi]